MLLLSSSLSSVVGSGGGDTAVWCLWTTDKFALTLLYIKSADIKTTVNNSRTACLFTAIYDRPYLITAEWSWGRVMGVEDRSDWSCVSPQWRLIWLGVKYEDSVSLYSCVYKIMTFLCVGSKFICSPSLHRLAENYNHFLSRAVARLLSLTLILPSLVLPPNTLPPKYDVVNRCFELDSL